MTLIETGKGPVEIRELHTVAEMRAAEQIQTQVWGSDTFAHPKEILIAVQHEGGLLAGAFNAQDELVSLIFGFPTRDAAAMHSQLLATLESWRGQGIGAQLKWFQRDWCLAHDYRRVRWTVDPLRAANAELNIRHLGGVSSTYYLEFYGPMTGIDAGAPTDRLLVEWDLASERVARRAQRVPEDRGFAQAEPAAEVEQGRLLHCRTGLTCPQILVRLPENFMRMSTVDPALATEWRLQTRELFLHYFNRGYAVSEFTRVGGPAYLLEKTGAENARG